MKFIGIKLLQNHACETTHTENIKKGKSVEESLERLQKLVVRDIRKEYPEVDYFDPDDLVQSMNDVYAEKGEAFVIIIDEWDAYADSSGISGLCMIWITDRFLSQTTRF